MFDIKEELKNLPLEPGVYIMHNQRDEIIYIGKAKNLKNRVTQYFRDTSSHTPKVRAMVSHVKYFEYIVTDTELEALVLECNLIKKHRPKYNILLKDDKHYPFIKVTMQEDYPRISMARRISNDGARYFGPYASMSTVHNTIDIIQKIFLPPTCNRKFPQDMGKGRPCLNYHIKNCFAPCTGKVTKEQYRQVFGEICVFLEGKHTDLKAQMEKDMKEASALMEFEKAASLRDKIRAIDKLEEKQKIFNADKSGDDCDIMAVVSEEIVSFAQVFFVRSGKVTGREAYELPGGESATEAELTESFLKQFYEDDRYIPPQVIIGADLDDRHLIEEFLRAKRGGRFSLVFPQRGEKVRLVELVKKNAQVEIDNYKLRTIRENKNKVLKMLQELLALDKEPKRIECYDISNISGADSVGVMAVFKDGKKAPSLYRNFRIKTVEGADDYASTQEVIYRRLRRAIEEQQQIDNGELLMSQAKFLPLPDLILADGGKGHVKVIKETVESMDLDICVYGLVKDKRHRTKGLVAPEGQVDITMGGPLFNFLTSIQDEVHRAAVTYFRKLHTAKSFKSELDMIEGVGKTRRNALLEHFGTISKIKKATFEELTKVVDKRTAENIIKFFSDTAV